MALSRLQKLLDRFALIEKIVVYVKDEGSNLQTCASAMNSIISCNSMGLLEPIDGLCFGHALSKVCQYATTNKNMFTNLSYTSIKRCSKCHLEMYYMTQKMGKGCQAWDKACMDTGLKLKN
jgi:hypothetical protein